MDKCSDCVCVCVCMCVCIYIKSSRRTTCTWMVLPHIAYEQAIQYIYRRRKNQRMTQVKMSNTYIHAVHSARVLTTHYRNQHIQANTRRGSIQSVS